jgi:capsid protein
LKSRRQAVAERGYSVEQLDEEISADRQREAAMGLSFNTDQQRPQP